VHVSYCLSSTATASALGMVLLNVVNEEVARQRECGGCGLELCSGAL